MALKFIKGLPVAWKGILYAFNREQNLRVQLCVFILVLILAVFLRIPRLHIFILLIVSFLVIILEILNTAVEILIKKLSPSYDKEYGLILDIVAGVTLLGVILSLIVGVGILIIPLIQVLQNIF
jgi:diacylglycerol kinase (ATP)